MWAMAMWGVRFETDPDPHMFEYKTKLAADQIRIVLGFSTAPLLNSNTATFRHQVGIDHIDILVGMPVK